MLLRLADNRSKAPEYMEGHNQWLKRGFEDGVFLLAGSLSPGLGGAIIAHDISASELEERIGKDPFVIENIVQAEIHEIDPEKADRRLGFLVGQNSGGTE